MPAWKNRDASRRRQERFDVHEPHGGHLRDALERTAPRRPSRAELNRVERLTRTATALGPERAGSYGGDEDLDAVAGELDRLLAARERGGADKKNTRGEQKRRSRTRRPSAGKPRRAEKARGERLSDVLGALDRLDQKVQGFADVDETDDHLNAYAPGPEEGYEDDRESHYGRDPYAEEQAYDGHPDDQYEPLVEDEYDDHADDYPEYETYHEPVSRQHRQPPLRRRTAAQVPHNASMDLYKDLGRRIEALRKPQQEAFHQVRQELGSLRDALGGYTRGTGEKVNRQNAELRRLSDMIERLQADRKGDLLAKEMRKEIADLKAMVARTNVEGSLHTLEHGYAHILQRLDELSRATVDPKALRGLATRLTEIEDAFAALPRGEHIVLLEDRISDIAARMEELLARKSHEEIEPLRTELQNLRHYVEQIDIGAMVEGIDDRMRFVSGRLDDLEELARGQQGLDSRLSAMEERMPAPDTLSRLQGRLEDIVGMMSDERASADVSADMSRVDSRLDEIVGRLDRIEQAPPPAIDDSAFSALSQRLDAITNKIDAIEKQASKPVVMPAPAAKQGSDADSKLLSQMQARLNVLSEQLEQPRDTVTTSDLDKLREEIGAMRASVPGPASTEVLEQRIQDLAQAVERGGDNLDDQRFEQLGAKVAALAEQLETSSQGSAEMEHVATALGRIETGLEDTRRDVVEIAQNAAREAIAGHAAGGSQQYDQVIQGLQSDLRRLLDTAEGSEERNRNTFDGMRAVLGSLTERLEKIERTEAAAAKPSAAFMAAQVEAERDLAVPETGSYAFAEPVPSRPADDFVARERPVQDRPAERIRDRKADFIAAARRAAQAASQEAEQLEAEAGAGGDDDTSGRSGSRMGWLRNALNRGKKAPKAAEEDAAEPEMPVAEEPVVELDDSSTVLPGDRPAPDETTSSGGRRKRALMFAAAAVILALGAVTVFRMVSSPAPISDQVAVANEKPENTLPHAADAGRDQPVAGSGLNQSGAEVPSATPPDPVKSSPQAADTGPASVPPSSVATAPSASHPPVVADGPAAPQPVLEAASNRSADNNTDLAFAPPADVSSSFGSEVTQPGSNFATDAPGSDASAIPANLVSNLPPEEVGTMALRSAAASGNPAAEFLVGVKYTEGNGIPADLAEAAKWYQKAAAKGLAPAQYRLASLYEKGRGVEKDLEKAKSWYIKAAEAGNPKAMHNLAVLYAEGAGGSPDFAKAAKWFEDAANYGVKDSLFNLGILYARGLGVQKDLAASYKWFAIAAEQGDRDAAKKRDDVANSMDQATLASARLAVENFKLKAPDPAASKVATDPEWADAGVGATNASVPLGTAIDYTSMVMKAQTQLNVLGFDTGKPDGQMGPKTRSAIKAFQRSVGLDETGVVDAELLKELESQSI